MMSDNESPKGAPISINSGVFDTNKGLSPELENLFKAEKVTGLPVIISGPSGVGKGTVVQELLDEHKDTLIRSVSVTTRHPRVNEVDGVDYFFKTKEEFKELIAQNQFLEYAVVFNDEFYGTPLFFFEENLKKGKDVILVIDVKGALEIKKTYKDGIYIFLLPPSLEELEMRLRDRKTEDDNAIKERLEKVKEELKMASHYDYLVINDIIKDTAFRLWAIIIAEHLKTTRQLKERKECQKE